MEPLAKGTVIAVRFPFSDLTRSKLRPALVIASLDRDDLILLQITSRPYGDKNALEIQEQDFVDGGLQKTSYVRPGKIFTGNQSLVTYPIGVLAETKTDEIISRLISLLSS